MVSVIVLIKVNLNLVVVNNAVRVVLLIVIRLIAGFALVKVVLTTTIDLLILSIFQLL